MAQILEQTEDPSFPPPPTETDLNVHRVELPETVLSPELFNQGTGTIPKVLNNLKGKDRDLDETQNIGKDKHQVDRETWKLLNSISKEESRALLAKLESVSSAVPNLNNTQRRSYEPPSPVDFVAPTPLNRTRSIPCRLSREKADEEGLDTFSNDRVKTFVIPPLHQTKITTRHQRSLENLFHQIGGFDQDLFIRFGELFNTSVPHKNLLKGVRCLKNEIGRAMCVGTDREELFRFRTRLHNYRVRAAADVKARSMEQARLENERAEQLSE